jgi:hypothetical protein
VAATGTGVSPLELDERADADSGPVVPLPELERREILRATK